MSDPCYWSQWNELINEWITHQQWGLLKLVFMPILFSNFTGICIRKNCIICSLLCFILTLFIFVYFRLTHESLYSCTFKRQSKIKLKSILFYYSAGKVWVWIFGTNIKARCGHMALSPQFCKRQRQEDLLLGIVGCMPIGLQVQWGTPSQ